MKSTYKVKYLHIRKEFLLFIGIKAKICFIITLTFDKYFNLKNYGNAKRI